MRALPLALALWLAGCQASYVAHVDAVRALIAQERFADAAEAEAAFAHADAAADRTLSLLNRGALLHDAGQFAASNACLLEAEDRLADFYRRSRGGELLRSSLSGASGDFLAEDHERLLVHVLAIENALALHQPDEALVEVRRMTGKLGVLADAKGHGRSDPGTALAHWLAGLLEEDDRALDDARLSLTAALGALPEGAPGVRAALCADLMRVRLQASVSDAPPVACAAIAPSPGVDDAETGEVVLLQALGTMGVRGQVRSQCGLLPDGLVRCFESDQPLPAGFTVAAIALPTLTPSTFTIQGARLVDDGGKAAQTEWIEDVQAIAARTLAERLPEDRRQATTRALARLAASAGAGIGAAKLTRGPGDQQAAIGLLVGALASTALSEAEEVDQRSWFTLPAAFALARLRLAPGLHHLHAELRDARGQVTRTLDLGEVRVRPQARSWLTLRTAR
jgi:hypothetical protein